MKKDTIFGWIRIIAGLFIFAFGVHLTIFANIGLAPWDCLGMGLSYHTPLNYGLSMTLIAVTVLGIDLLLKEKNRLRDHHRCTSYWKFRAAV